MELWPVVGAVGLSVLAVYAIVVVVFEVRGAVRRRRWRRLRSEHEAEQG